MTNSKIRILNNIRPSEPKYYTWNKSFKENQTLSTLKNESVIRLFMLRSSMNSGGYYGDSILRSPII